MNTPLPHLSHKSPHTRPNLGFPGLRARLRRPAVVVAATAAMIAAPAATAAAASPAGPQQTTDFAGYLSQLTGTVSTLSGTIAMPAGVTCPASGTASLQPGIALTTTGAKNYLLFNANEVCTNGSLSDEGFFASIYPGAGGNSLAAANIAAGPGDNVHFTLSITAGHAHMVISDRTTGTNGTASAPVTGTLATAEPGLDIAWSGSPGSVPGFTPAISFSALKAGTASLSTFPNTEFEIFNLTTEQVATSKFSATGSFKTTFVHS